jgi:hypothetical protein
MTKTYQRLTQSAGSKLFRQHFRPRYHRLIGWHSIIVCGILDASRRPGTIIHLGLERLFGTNWKGNGREILGNTLNSLKLFNYLNPNLFQYIHRIIFLLVKVNHRKIE